jgi:nucleotide-binding universal stress UspA family protein
VAGKQEVDMFKHILIPTDGSEFSAKVVKDAVALAKAVKAKITAVHVVVPPRFTPLDFSAFVMALDDRVEKHVAQAFQSAGEKYLNRIQAAAEAAGVAFNRVVLTSGEPWKGIIKTADKKGCDLIVMAAHGQRGLSALLIGSETNKVLTHSKIPVLVYR